MRMILIWLLGFLNRRGLKLLRNFKPQSQACQFFEAQFFEIVKSFFQIFFQMRMILIWNFAQKNGAVQKLNSPNKIEFCWLRIKLERYCSPNF